MIAGTAKLASITIKRQQGAVLVTVLLFLFISLLLITDNMRQSLWQLRFADSNILQLQRAYLADKSLAQIIQGLQSGAAIPCRQSMQAQNPVRQWQQAPYCFVRGRFFNLSYLIEDYPDRFKQPYCRITLAILNQHNHAKTVRQASYTVHHTTKGVQYELSSWRAITEG